MACARSRLAQGVHHHAAGADGGERIDDVLAGVFGARCRPWARTWTRPRIDVAAGRDAQAALNDGGQVGVIVANRFLG